MPNPGNRIFYLFCFLLPAGLALSAISPHDYFTWILEVFPAVIAFPVILVTHKKFPLSNLLYLLILIHCYILFIGGHYTYAKVPLFDTIKEFFISKEIITTSWGTLSRVLFLQLLRGKFLSANKW
jgi:uncharacterized membrane protein YjdF